MINREATIKYKGYDPDELKSKSQKRVCVICDDCGRVRWMGMAFVKHLCGNCTSKRRWAKDSERKLQSERRLKYFEENPDKILRGFDHHLYGKPLTNKHKRNISDSNLGHEVSDLTRNKISVANIVKVRTDEMNEINRLLHLGKVASDETRYKMSLSQKEYWKLHPDEAKERFSHLAGDNNPAKRIDVRKKIVEANTGRKHTPEAIENMRNAHKTKEYFEKMGGPNNPNWQGGISYGAYCYKFNEKFKEKIRWQYNRNCFLCSMDEEENGRRLSVHHVNHNKDCLCNGSCEFVPLCNKCHAITSGKYVKKYWEDLIMCHLYPDRITMIDQ
jgi:hypothetical protein